MKTTEFQDQGSYEYPGRRYDGNFLLVDAEVVPMPEDPIFAVRQMDEKLQSRGLPLIEDRVPVLAFGRNAGPAGAAEKTGKYSNGAISVADLTTVPMLKGTLHGHDIVWHGRPGKTGNYFSELLASDETADTEVEVWVQFLTNEQLAAIHVTEGPTYGLRDIDGVSLGNDVVIGTVGYAARDASILLDDDGKPVAMAGADRKNSELLVMNEREALEYTLGRAAVARAAGTELADEYQAKAKSLKAGKERDDLQSSVHGVMEREGMSRRYAYSSDGMRYSRIDFDDLPHGLSGKRIKPEFVSFMEQSIAKIRPTKDAASKKIAELAAKYPDESSERTTERVRNLLDPATKLRERYYEELLDPRREEELAKLVAHGVVKFKHSDNDTATV